MQDGDELDDEKSDDDSNTEGTRRARTRDESDDRETAKKPSRN